MRKPNQKFVVGIATLGLLASMGAIPASAAANTARLAGNDRIDTALQVATHAFAGQKPSVLYVASGDNAHLVDSTTAGKLADGPLLYAPTTAAGIAKLGAALAENPTFSEVKQVVAIGGNASVHEETLQSLATAVKASQTERLAGANRYETAAKIAAHIITQAKGGNKAYTAILDKNGQPRTVYIANGSDSHLVDSMVAGTLGDGPTLLARPDGTLDAESQQLLMKNQPTEVTGLGGAGAISGTALSQAARVAGAKNVSRLGGADRFATAAQVAQRYVQVHGAPAEVYVATGGAAADAIIGGQLKRGPILLVAPNGAPAATSNVLQSLAKQAGKDLKVVGLGGQGSLPETALQATANLATPSKPANPAPSAKPNSNTGSSSGSAGSGSANAGSGSSSNSGSGAGSGSAKPAPNPAPKPNLPQQSANPNSATLTVSDPSVEITIKIGSNIAVDASVKEVKYNNADTTKLKVIPKLHNPGVFTVTAANDTPAGMYNITFHTGDGRITGALIQVERKYSTPPDLVAISGSVSVSATPQVIATFDHNTINRFDTLRTELQRYKGASYVMSENDFEVEITSTDINDRDLVSIKGSAKVNPDSGEVKAIIPPKFDTNDPDYKGKSFKVKVRVRATLDGPSPSDYTNEVAVNIAR